MQKSPQLPASVTTMPINLIGLTTMILALFALRYSGQTTYTINNGLILLAALGLPIIILECTFLKTYRRPTTGFDFSQTRTVNMRRIALKLAGFYATIAALAFLYWALPEYRGGFYIRYYSFLLAILPLILISPIVYFFLFDGWMTDPQDGYWQVGALITGKWSAIDHTKIRQHFLGWLVKGFFLPLMFTEFSFKTDYFLGLSAAHLTLSVKTIYDLGFNALFAIDVLYVTVGYIMTIRIFDSHIRTTEPTMFGWAVALMCYQPFWSFFEQAYLRYDNGHPWGAVFAGYPTLYNVWAMLIIVFLGIYLWATLPFGIRFSNLTNRGIVTNGPYRYCKHPAYVSKNFAWWLMSLPFLAGATSFESLRFSLLLLGLNMVYLLRARTEERHLSRDPTYHAYALAMEQRSLFRWIRRLFPMMRYRPTTTLSF